MAVTSLRHRRALQVSAHGQGTRVDLLQVSDGGIQIEQTNMTDNQASNSRRLGNATDDRRWSVQRTRRTCGSGEMHDQDIRPACEVDELWVGPSLIGAEHNRRTAHLYAIRQRWDIAMGYAQRGHGDSLLIEHRRWFRFRHIHDTDLETNASPHASHRRTAQRGPEHLKGAMLCIEQATEEGRKIWHEVVPGRTDNR